MSEGTENQQISTELVVATDPTALMPAMTIEMAIEAHQTLRGFIKKMLGSGKIPGVDKPSLLLPDAEKLRGFYGLSTPIEQVNVVEDWTGEEHGGEPFFRYHYKCQVLKSGRLIAECEGECNSWDRRYRFRWVNMSELPPGIGAIEKSSLPQQIGAVEEYAWAINKAETSGKYGKPEEYWQEFKDMIKTGQAEKITKTTRAGKEQAAYRIETVLYQIPNPDIYALVNTIMKMAQKRAFVGAIKVATNASEFYTQDVEDLEGVIDGTYTEVKEEKKAEPKKQKAKETTARAKAKAAREAPEGGIGEETGPTEEEAFNQMARVAVEKGILTEKAAKSCQVPYTDTKTSKVDWDKALLRLSYVVMAKNAVSDGIATDKMIKNIVTNSTKDGAADYAVALQSLNELASAGAAATAPPDASWEETVKKFGIPKDEEAKILQEASKKDNEDGVIDYDLAVAMARDWAAEQVEEE